MTFGEQLMTGREPWIVAATVMMDLSKAFDTINHSLLLKKLYMWK